MWEASSRGTANRAQFGQVCSVLPRQDHTAPLQPREHHFRESQRAHRGLAAEEDKNIFALRYISPIQKDFSIAEV